MDARSTTAVQQYPQAADDLFLLTERDVRSIIILLMYEYHTLTRAYLNSVKTKGNLKMKNTAVIFHPCGAEFVLGGICQKALY